MTRTRVLMAVVVIAGGAVAPLSLQAAQDRAFCDDPVWCDPIRGLTAAVGPGGALVQPPGVERAAVGTHERRNVSVNAAIGAGTDAGGAVFLQALKGQGVPAGERVAMVYGKSLGAVTRRTANAGMPHAVRIDDPAFDQRPNAVVVATRLAAPGGGTGAVGVWYDGAHWWIYDEGQAPMAAGETFFYVEGTPLGGRVVHSAANDHQGIGLYLDDARLNGNPAAVVVAQHGFVGAYNRAPLGVAYDPARGQWLVYNEDASSFPIGEAVHYVTAP